MKVFKERTGTFLKHALGGIFIVSGVAAGFVPLVPGIVLVLIGLLIISQNWPWLKAKIDHFRGRHVVLDEILTALEGGAGSTWRFVRGKRSLF